MPTHSQLNYWWTSVKENKYVIFRGTFMLFKVVQIVVNTIFLRLEQGLNLLRVGLQKSVQEC